MNEIALTEDYTILIEKIDRKLQQAESMLMIMIASDEFFDFDKNKLRNYFSALEDLISDTFSISRELPRL